MKNVCIRTVMTAVVMSFLGLCNVLAADGAVSLEKADITFSVEDQNIENVFDNNDNTRLYCTGGNNSYGFVFAFEDDVVIGGVRYVPYAASEEGTVNEAGIYASNDGEVYYKVGDFTAQTCVKATTYTLPNPVKARYIKFWTSRTVKGSISIAGLSLLGGNDSGLTLAEAEKKLEQNSYHDIKQGIRAMASSSESGNGVGNLTDTNQATFWHSRFQPQRDYPPFTIVFDLGTQMEISGLSYLPRQDSYENGRFMKCDIMISDDAAKYNKIAETDWENNYLRKKIYFSPVRTRYLKVVINKTNDDYAIAADLTVLQSEQSNLAGRRKNYVRYTLKIGENVFTLQQGTNLTEYKIQSSPVVINGNTMIPLRGVAEAMGYTVTWRDEDRTIYIEKPGCKMEMQIDDDRLYMNGARYNFEEPPIIINDFTMIPIRLFSELSGFDVRWNGELQTIYIGNDLDLEW